MAKSKTNNVDVKEADTTNNSDVYVTLRYRSSHTIADKTFYKGKTKQISKEFYQKHKRSFEEKRRDGETALPYFEIGGNQQ